MTEVYTARWTTTLSGALSTTSRPTTISVAATQAAYGAGTFSIAIYNVGTDANPVNYEVLEVTSGGATTTWTVVTELGYTPLTHASGSTVVATILSPRSVSQPMLDHTNTGTTPDPHPVYVAKNNFSNKGQLLVGTGSSTFTVLSVGADGTSPIADSTATAGIRWTGLNVTAVLQHMGDLVVGGLLGAAARLGVGSARTGPGCVA